MTDRLTTQQLDLDAISARAADAQQYGIEDDGFEQLVREDVPALVAEVRRFRAAVLPPPVSRADALSETERRMLEYALDLADEEIATDGADFTDEEEDALAELRRIVTKPIATAAGQGQDGAAS